MRRPSRASTRERALARWQQVFGAALRDAVRHVPKERPLGHRARLPRRRRGRAARAGLGVARVPRAAARDTSRGRSTSTTTRASARFATSGVDADDRHASTTPDVVAEYERQRVEARSASGSPAQAQDKTSTSDGPVRFTAPSVVFRRGEETAVAGGWQPLLAYDMLLANFAPDLERVPSPGIARAAPRVLPRRARRRPRSRCSSPRAPTRSRIARPPSTCSPARRRRTSGAHGARHRRDLEPGVGQSSANDPAAELAAG